MTRLDVRKTYKLYIGGAFPRSESGRTYEVTDTRGRFVANLPLASRKDARDAVVAARGAESGWAAATAYNRGQVLYRVAEILEGRREQFILELRATGGVTPQRAEAEVDAAIDRWVWFAGWTDKLTMIDGSSNPVAGPYFNFSVPEPMGVVAVIAPQHSALLGLISVVAPVLVAGNACVVVAAQRSPLVAVTLAEVLATSDVPGGVVNVLTGDTAELAVPLAEHRDVNGIDLVGIRDGELARTLEMAAADNVKRVRRAPPIEPDWAYAAGPHAALAWCETKTVWHPVGI